MSIDYRPDNTIIFTLARMNPPTPGHLYLIQRLIEQAIAKNVTEVYIILSKTNDNNENPIPCPEKINVLGDANDETTKTMIKSLKESMINETADPSLKTKIRELKVITICVPDVPRATPFTQVGTIISSKPKGIKDFNLFLIIGEDRKDMLDSITKFYLDTPYYPNINSVDGEILPREEMSKYKQQSADPELLDKLDMSTVPVNAMSASFVRNIVKNDRRNKFIELYKPYLDEQKTFDLYNSISNGINSLKPNTKKDGPVKPLIYTYPMIRGISVFKKRGGKKTIKVNKSKYKTRRNKRKSRRNKRKNTRKNK